MQGISYIISEGLERPNWAWWTGPENSNQEKKAISSRPEEAVLLRTRTQCHWEKTRWLGVGMETERNTENKKDWVAPFALAPSSIGAPAWPNASLTRKLGQAPCSARQCSQASRRGFGPNPGGARPRTWAVRWMLCNFPSTSKEQLWISHWLSLTLCLFIFEIRSFAIREVRNCPVTQFNVYFFVFGRGVKQRKGFRSLVFQMLFAS